MNIIGNEEADKLTKKGMEGETIPITKHYQNTHTSPYWLHRAKPYHMGTLSKTPLETTKNT
jgi:hypothetical protein